MFLSTCTSKNHGHIKLNKQVWFPRTHKTTFCDHADYFLFETKLYSITECLTIHIIITMQNGKRDKIPQSMTNIVDYCTQTKKTFECSTKFFNHIFELYNHIFSLFNHVLWQPNFDINLSHPSMKDTYKYPSMFKLASRPVGKPTSALV